MKACYGQMRLFTGDCSSRTKSREPVSASLSSAIQSCPWFSVSIFYCAPVWSSSSAEQLLNAASGPPWRMHSCAEQHRDWHRRLQRMEMSGPVSRLEVKDTARLEPWSTCVKVVAWDQNHTSGSFNSQIKWWFSGPPERCESHLLRSQHWDAREGRRPTTQNENLACSGPRSASPREVIGPYTTDEPVATPISSILIMACGTGA